LARWHRSLLTDRTGLGHYQCQSRSLGAGRSAPRWPQDKTDTHVLHRLYAKLTHDLTAFSAMVPEAIDQIPTFLDARRAAAAQVLERSDQDERSLLGRLEQGVLTAADFATHVADIRARRDSAQALMAETDGYSFACVHATPDDVVMAQVARNLTMTDTGFLAQHGITHLIQDNDGKYPPTFERILYTAGVESVFSPVAAPNANTHSERFIKSVQDECLDRLWFIGEKALRLVLHEYVEHYHRERNHQGIGHALIDPGPEVKISEGGIHRRKRLGGLLNYYHREAA